MNSSLQIAMTATEAKQVTNRIKLLIDSTANQIEKIAALVQQAHDGKVWSTLGYESWPAYLAGEFAGEFAHLERATKHEAIRMLSFEGMSTRAISAMTGVGKSTVHRDLQQVSQSGTPDDPVVGTDGKSYPRKASFLPSGKPDARSTDDMGNAVPKPAPKPRQLPLPKSYFKFSYDLLKRAESLARLHQDDRFARNRETVAMRHGPELARAANTLLDLLDDLGVDRHRFGFMGDPDD